MGKWLHKDPQASPLQTLRVWVGIFSRAQRRHPEYLPQLYKNRKKMQALMTGALKAAKARGANVENGVAVGYCFGGAAVLELARSGANLKGFVTAVAGILLTLHIRSAKRSTVCWSWRIPDNSLIDTSTHNSRTLAGKRFLKTDSAGAFFDVTKTRFP